MLNIMHLWKEFLDSLATTGGAIFMLFVLMVMGALMLKIGILSGEQVVRDSFIAIVAVLGAKRLNNGKSQDPTKGE